MRRTIVFLSLMALGVGASGCTPKYPRCETDAHCAEKGEVCFQGACQQCGRDADCKAGFVCKDTRCAPGPECRADLDCPSGQRCRAERCRPECSADAECAGGMRCRQGRCAPAAECASDADCPAGKVCGAGQVCLAAEEPAGGACSLSRVHFPFNEWTLTAEARAALEQSAACLRQRPRKIQLSGHADERGTEEYNLHLGERRAAAARKYLETLGVEASHLGTVSFGEERPSNPGHGEAAWAENRRVELEEPGRGNR